MGNIGSEELQAKPQAHKVDFGAKKLSLANIPIGPHNGTLLAKKLQTCQNICHVDLSNTKIDHTVILCLYVALTTPGCNISHLNLSNNRLTDRSLVALVHLCSTNTSLRQLVLCSNQFTVNTATYFVKEFAISPVSKCEVIDLRENNLPQRLIDIGLSLVGYRSQKALAMTTTPVVESYFDDSLDASLEHSSKFSSSGQLTRSGTQTSVHVIKNDSESDSDLSSEDDSAYVNVGNNSPLVRPSRSRTTSMSALAPSPSFSTPSKNRSELSTLMEGVPETMIDESLDQYPSPRVKGSSRARLSISTATPASKPSRRVSKVEPSTSKIKEAKEKTNETRDIREKVSEEDTTSSPHPDVGYSAPVKSRKKERAKPESVVKLTDEDLFDVPTGNVKKSHRSESTGGSRSRSASTITSPPPRKQSIGFFSPSAPIAEDDSPRKPRESMNIPSIAETEQKITPADVKATAKSFFIENVAVMHLTKEQADADFSLFKSSCSKYFNAKVTAFDFFALLHSLFPSHQLEKMMPLLLHLCSLSPNDSSVSSHQLRDDLQEIWVECLANGLSLPERKSPITDSASTSISSDSVSSIQLKSKIISPSVESEASDSLSKSPPPKAINTPFRPAGAFSYTSVLPKLTPTTTTDTPSTIVEEDVKVSTETASTSPRPRSDVNTRPSTSASASTSMPSPSNNDLITIALNSWAECSVLPSYYTLLNPSFIAPDSDTLQKSRKKPNVIALLRLLHDIIPPTPETSCVIYFDDVYKSSKVLPKATIYRFSLPLFFPELSYEKVESVAESASVTTDTFSALGSVSLAQLPLTISPVIVKKVYKKAIKFLHPDKQPRNTSPDQLELFGGVFAIIQQAFERFSRKNPL